MKYYRSNITNKIVPEYKVKAAYDIFGKLHTLGELVEVDSPSVLDCLNSGSFSTAVERYKEINGCTKKEAINGVSIMRGQVSRFRKKNRRESSEPPALMALT